MIIDDLITLSKSDESDSEGCKFISSMKGLRFWSIKTSNPYSSKYWFWFKCSFEQLSIILC